MSEWWVTVSCYVFILVTCIIKQIQVIHIPDVTTLHKITCSLCFSCLFKHMYPVVYVLYDLLLQTLLYVTDVGIGMD